MDTDAQALQNALSAIREQFGAQLAGPKQRTEADLRGAVQTRLGVDELTADRLVKQLTQTGQLAYAGTEDIGSEPGTSTTGPVISMPMTQSGPTAAPLLATVDPALMMGAVNNPGGGIIGSSAIGTAAADTALTGGEARSADPVRGGQAGFDVAENNVGATMGQLGDTNAEGASAPITVGEREEAQDDRTNGYWRIG